jgi:hypothetical protein
LLRPLALPLLIFMSNPAPAQAPASARTVPLEIAAEDAADLWSRADGTGLANEVVRAAFLAAGVEVTFRVVPYARCKQMVREGSVAACFSMSRDPELKGVVLFPSTPIFTCFSELVQDKAHPAPAARLRDLPRGTVVGTVLGYEYPDALRAAAKSGAVVLDESPSEEMLLRKLAAGRLPAAVLNVNAEKSIEYVTASAHLPGNAERLDRVGELASFVGFSAKNPQGPVALKKFEEGIRVVIANGTVAAISRRWADTSAAVIRASRAPVKRP